MALLGWRDWRKGGRLVIWNQAVDDALEEGTFCVLRELDALLENLRGSFSVHKGSIRSTLGLLS